MNHNQVKHCYHYDHYLFFHDHDDNYEPLDCVDYCYDHYEPEDNYDHYDLDYDDHYETDKPGVSMLHLWHMMIITNLMIIMNLIIIMINVTIMKNLMIMINLMILLMIIIHHGKFV